MSYEKNLAFWLHQTIYNYTHANSAASSFAGLCIASCTLIHACNSHLRGWLIVTFCKSVSAKAPRCLRRISFTHAPSISHHCPSISSFLPSSRVATFPYTLRLHYVFRRTNHLRHSRSPTNSSSFCFCQPMQLRITAHRSFKATRCLIDEIPSVRRKKND